ncbi:major facilitator superfamily MFS_1 [Cellulomonas flavigena DSM 20109]|uniref:Major facilitator superfamily MFS_1 n=1 Tax=Cellulomonas flavigena (strain ATCC 482 / DSM 20109 / BCRC 11376 / JCM 18109 / NBRC 3775 / NCIMB 8073 / NRS 134) TaxID=446466 RepID=D5UF00_CELFN|nr:MFS transporter [Cellulomonas flavigena]ADG74810.1 major facilitator superfamily MFS_1 [Cellulomonas flavigena DSM 20109]
MSDPAHDVRLRSDGPDELFAAARRRTVAVLACAGVLGGLAAGTVVSVGSLLAVELSGADRWAGSVTTAATLGAAVASIGLARLAVAHGRRRALSTGLALAATGATGVVVAAVVASFPLLLVAGVLLGVGSAVNLQSRFAATDLSTPSTRARDLSLVVWAGTVGAVVGPNLVGLNEPVSRLTGLPEHAPVFVVSTLGMLAALIVVQAGLRPDPLDVAGRTGAATGRRRHVPLRVAVAVLRRHPQALGALLGVLVAHGVMIAVMSTTPVHMEGHGASISLVGLTVSLHLAAMFALSPLIGLLADRVGAGRALLAGLAVVVAACAVCATAHGDHVRVTVGLVLLGLGWSVATVAGSSLVAAAVPGAERVAVQGLSDAAMSLAGAGGGALAGVWLEVVGYGGLAAVSGAVTVAGVLAVLVVVRGRVPVADASALLPR